MSYILSTGGVSDGSKGDIIVSGGGTTWSLNSDWGLPVSQVTIKSLADFPAPVSGVITLVDNTTYLINGNVDIGTNTITVGIRNTISGVDRYNDKLTSTTTGTMFTMDSSSTNKLSLVFDTITIGAVNGTLFNVTGGTAQVVTLITTTISSTLNGGTFTGTAFSMRTSSVSSSFTSNGFIFTGTNTSFILRDSTIANNTGTAFNLSSTYFTNFCGISRNYILSNASQLIFNLNGITTGITSNIHGNTITGVGVYFYGVDENSIGWRLYDNVGINNTTSNIDYSDDFSSIWDCIDGLIIELMNERWKFKDNDIINRINKLKTKTI